MFDMLTQ